MPRVHSSLFPALRWFGALGLLACGLALGAAPDAHAAPPDAAKVRTAASEFDLGVKALEAKDFAVAAAHFEAADAAVPSDKALRRAILARTDAGQGSRAATLAALVLVRHPDSAAAVKLANDTLARFEPSLHKVQIRCAPPCILAVGTRAVHGEATTRWTVYLDPGSAQLSASFAGGTSASAQLKARAGGETELRLEPPAGAATPQPEPTAPTQPAPAPTPPVGATEPAPRARSGLPVWVFPLGLVATAGAGGALVWSGLDTLENPGVDAVREGCVGLGPGCPLYQQGLDAQLRTNVLIGVTGGLGAVTAVLIGFTDFGGKAPAKSTWRPSGIVPVALPGGGLGVAVAGRF